MASSSIVQQRTSLAARARSIKAKAEDIEITVMAGAASAGIGFLEARGTLPVSVFGLPTKLALAIGTGLAAANSSGSARRLARSAMLGAVCSYAYAGGKSGSFVAGDENGGGV